MTSAQRPTSRKSGRVARDYGEGWLAGRADDPRVPSVEIPTDGWYVHAATTVLARSDGSWLGWPPSSAVAPAFVKPSKEMLYRFTNLRNADDEAIADFAREWGSLNLCRKHALPVTDYAGSFFTRPVCDYTAWERAERTGEGYEQHHNPPAPAAGIEPCLPAAAWIEGDSASEWRIESVDAWRDYANAIGAIVALTLAMKCNDDSGEKTEAEWAVLGVDAKRLIRSPASTLEWWVNQWLTMAGVRLVVEASDESMSLAPRLKTTSLFAGLMTELLSAVAAPGGLALCSECGALFSPGRKPNRSRRVFCKECSESGAPLKWAARDYKARARSADRSTRGRSADG